MMNYFILIGLILPITSILAVKPLYKITGDDASRTRPCKKNKDAISCRKIDLDFSLIETQADIFIPEVNAVLSFQSLVLETESDKVFHYKNKDYDSVTLDIAKREVSVQKSGMWPEMQPIYVVASIHVGSHVFEIDACSSKNKGGCHVLVELDPTKFVEEARADSISDGMTAAPRNGGSLARERKTKWAEKPILQVKVYYTRALLNDFESKEELKAFINVVVADCNDGYKNSGISLEVKLHSTELSHLHDNDRDMSAQLEAFEHSKENICSIRDGADAAILLTRGGNSCGIANTNIISTGNTLAVVKKVCAAGYYTFGHEIAHMAGALHSKEQHGYVVDGYGYGKLIKDHNGRPSGYRTIMAYPAHGYDTRINFYSSSTNKFHGYDLGSSTEDNTRLMNEQAARFAMIDETIPCSNKNMGYNLVPLPGFSLMITLLIVIIMTM